MSGPSDHSFTAPDEYDRFMGRYSAGLAPEFARFAGIRTGATVVDVGCGPGALTAALADRAGPASVAGADPSPQFVAACAARVPGADIREAGAERLPWADGEFDAALAQLVLHFMSDARAGVTEMARVVRDGGTVAACTWDSEGAMTMLHHFWEAALALDPAAPAYRDRTSLGGPDGLRELWGSAGLGDVSIEAIDVNAEYSGFDELWGTFGLGIGPAGSYCASLEPERREALRDGFRARLGDPGAPLELEARAWAVRGLVPG